MHPGGVSRAPLVYFPAIGFDPRYRGVIPESAFDKFIVSGCSREIITHDLRDFLPSVDERCSTSEPPQPISCIFYVLIASIAYFMPEDIDRIIRELCAAKSTGKGSDQEAVWHSYRKALDARKLVRSYLTWAPHPSLTFFSSVGICGTGSTMRGCTKRMRAKMSDPPASISEHPSRIVRSNTDNV